MQESEWFHCQVLDIRYQPTNQPTNPVFNTITSGLVSIMGNGGQKIRNVLLRNPGYKKICKIQDILERKSLGIPEPVSTFKYAPISHDIETSFQDTRVS